MAGLLLPGITFATLDCYEPNPCVIPVFTVFSGLLGFVPAFLIVLVFALFRKPQSKRAVPKDSPTLFNLFRS